MIAVLAGYMLLFQAVLGTPVQAAPISLSAYPICHTLAAGAEAVSERPVPAAPISAHECCDLCALLTPVILPGQPAFFHRAPNVRPAPGLMSALAVRRSVQMRTPRQAQGPPAA